jgi:hypothetical protein
LRQAGVEVCNADVEGFKVGIAGCKVLPAGLLIGMLAGLEGAAKKMRGNTLEQGFDGDDNNLSRVHGAFLVHSLLCSSDTLLVKTTSKV